MVFHCDSCDIDLLDNSRSSHLHTKKHLSLVGSGVKTSEKSKDKYMRGLLLIAKHLNKDMTDVKKWIDDKKTIVDMLERKYPNNNTRLYYLNCLQFYSKKEGKGVYSDEINDTNKLIRDFRDTNKLSDRQDKFDGLEWKKDFIDKVDMKLLNDEEKVLIGLYMFFPPRRISIYSDMYYTKKGVNNLPSKDRNYITLSRNGIPQKFIFQVYKTFKHYGKQVYDIPPELKKLLKNLSDREKLFNQDENGLSKKLMSLCEKHLGHSFGSNILRRMFITDFLDKKRTVEERKKMSEIMGHSEAQQSLYNIVQ